MSTPPSLLACTINSPSRHLMVDLVSLASCFAPSPYPNPPPHSHFSSHLVPSKQFTSLPRHVGCCHVLDMSYVSSPITRAPSRSLLLLTAYWGLSSREASSNRGSYEVHLFDPPTRQTRCCLLSCVVIFSFRPRTGLISVILILIHLCEKSSVFHCPSLDS